MVLFYKAEINSYVILRMEL